MKETKTLYFEGAGCVPRGEVENCRIRTAFHTNKGEAVYLEILGFEVTKNSRPSLKKYTNAGFIDSCFYIKGDDDENKHSIKGMRDQSFEYTKAEILNVVNSLGCSFDEVVILPDLAGYRVFKDDGGQSNDGYNFGDEFSYNAERTARAEEIKAYFYALEKSEGKQYPNFSLWVDGQDPGMLHLLRHFPGYNRHWTIRTDTENWQETITEKTLGKYAC
jgi:hypothetical protein